MSVASPSPRPLQDDRDPVQIDSPFEIARLLWSSSPEKAANFARAQHEKACWDPFGERAEFWQHVLAEISALRQRRSGADS